MHNNQRSKLNPCDREVALLGNEAKWYVIDSRNAFLDYGKIFSYYYFRNNLNNNILLVLNIEKTS